MVPVIVTVKHYNASSFAKLIDSNRTPTPAAGSYTPFF